MEVEVAILVTLCRTGGHPGDQGQGMDIGWHCPCQGYHRALKINEEMKPDPIAACKIC
jgi:hypothetical protein